jgi:pimeloyl-ACP methyl ester carboxylesterase
MTQTTTNTLKVPGATLYYEVRGAGPVLLLICGGVYDAAGYAGLAGQLADRYTVVTYDRRGNSRSPLNGPPLEQRIDVHSDDAHRLLDVVADGPAYVFGNSSGAEIGLDLVARHPEQVRTLVAHEPPIFDVLPDRDHFSTLMQNVAETFATKGAGAAGEVFGAGLQMRGGDDDERIAGGGAAPQGEPDPETAQMMDRMAKNFEFFIGYEVPPFGRYSPDLAALKVSGTRIVMAAGEESVGEAPNRAAFAVAERLGGEAVMFPGDHGGFGALGDAFAERLQAVLSAS